jgi:alkylated DNA repair dioxygenase AlkB
VSLPPGFNYLRGFISDEYASSLLDELWEGIDWLQQEIMLFGKARLQPRLTAWCSDPGVEYSYSGLHLAHKPWQRALAELRDTLQVKTGHSFNSVLLNAYRDGRDSMGWHADDESELGTEPCIASVSLGATRRFRLRPTVGGPSIGLDLEHGSLLMMSGSSQADWRHCIPRTRREVGLRVNLTYRLIV